MKKKLLAMVMATAMVASLVGCGGQSNSSTGGDTTPAETNSEDSSAGDSSAGDSAAEETPAVEEEEAITATIKVWSPTEDQSEEQGKWLQTMCEQFAAEHPNWTLTFDYGICAEHEAKTLVTQDVEAAADVFMYANDNLPDLIASNAIAKLGGETAEYVKSTNSQAIVDSVSVNGDIYGVPFTTNTWFMYYDTSVFTEEEASNLDTMLAKDKVSFPITNSWYNASFFVANGCTFFGDGTDGAAGIDYSGDKGIGAAKYMVELVKNPNFVDDRDGSGIAGLRDGSIKAIFSGSWDYNSVKEILGDNFGAKELPTITIDGAQKQLMAFAGSKAIGVNATTKNPQVAVALAKYLGGAKAQQAHYNLRSVVPCNTDLLESVDLQSDALVVAQNTTFDSTSIIQPFVTEMNNYWSPAENFGKAIVNGEVTDDNIAQKIEDLNTSLNTTVVD